MKKASPFICGTVILTLSNFLSRLIGFYNRIFLAGVIGAHQIGIYQLIFPVYLLGFAVCFQGFQIALSKITAEKKAAENMNAARLVLRITIILTLCLCIIFSFFVFLYAEEICSVFLHEPACVPCLRLAVLVLPFVGIKNCIHGYYLGIENSRVPALSLCLEQISRVSSIFLLSIFMMEKMPVAAFLAVCGMAVGEIVSFFFTVIYYILHKRADLTSVSSTSFLSKHSAFYELLSLGIPLTLNSLSVTLLQSVQSILIPMMLYRFYGNHYRSVEIYGILSGMALPFIMFPSTITNALSLMLLPKISAAKAENNPAYLRRCATWPLIFCMILGMGAFGGFFVLGPWIGNFFFHNRLCGEYLRLLSFLCPFLYCSSILSTILNGLGKTKDTLLHNSVSLVIQICFILFGIPLWGVAGYFWGLMGSSLFLCWANYRKLRVVI